MPRYSKSLRAGAALDARKPSNICSDRQPAPRLEGPEDRMPAPNLGESEEHR